LPFWVVGEPQAQLAVGACHVAGLGVAQVGGDVRALSIRALICWRVRVVLVAAWRSSASAWSRWASASVIHLPISSGSPPASSAAR